MIKAVSYIVSVILMFYSFSFGAVGVEEDDVKEVIRDGLYDFSESIDISVFGIYPEELTEIVSEVIKDDPYLFFVNGRMSYSRQVGGHVLSLNPTYNMSEGEALYAWEYCRRIVRNMASRAMVYEKSWERALFLHDLICKAFDYDESLESGDMFSFFETGRGTCQSYAATYIAVMRECGIPCSFVASDTISHIWNCVEIDGEWFHVDLTWDDQDFLVSRRHFLLSDSEALAKGHKDWYSARGLVCVSDRFLEVDFDSWLIDRHLTGDGDHDGRVGLSDLLLLRRRIEMNRDDDFCFSCVDIDLDGVLDLTDVYLLRKKLVEAD